MKVFTVFWLLLVGVTQAESISVGTYNIRNFPYDERLGIPTDRKLLAQTLEELHFDILGVQEITEPDEFSFLVAKLPGNYKALLSTCGGANEQSLGFVYNQDRLKLVEFYEDVRLSVSSPNGQPACYHGSRPLVWAVFENKATGSKYTAMVVHLKAGGRDKDHNKRKYQLNTLGQIMKELKGQGKENFILLGDFNSTHFKNNGRDRLAIESMVDKNAMRLLENNMACTSYWWGGVDDDLEHPSHLDQVLLDDNIIRSMPRYSVSSSSFCSRVKCKVSSAQSLGDLYLEVSDHCPVMVTLYE